MHEQLTALEWARTKAKWFFSAMALVMVGALFFGLQTGDVQCGHAGTNPQAEWQARRSEPIAKVGTAVIPRLEYERQVRQTEERVQAQNPPGTLIDPLGSFQMKAQAITGLIMSEILEAKALEYGLTPSKEAVDEQMRMIQAQLVPTPGIMTERSILQKISDGLQEKKRRNQFATAVRQIWHLSVADLRQQIELEIIRQEYGKVLEKEAEEAARKDVRDQLEGYRAEIEGGKPFQELAKEHSLDIETKDAGGRIDQISVAQIHNDYGEEYVKAIHTLQPGALSAPVFSEPRNGYFLIKLDTFRPASGPEFEAGKEEVRQRILEQKRQQAAADPEAGVVVDASEDEIKEAWEVASLWHLFVPVGDPAQKQEAILKEIVAAANIEVSDPEARAGYLMVMQEDYPGATAALIEALEQKKAQHAQDLARETNAEYRESIELAAQLEEAEYLYAIGQLKAITPDQADQKRMQAFFAAMQSGADFDSFPEQTDEEKAEAERLRTEALAHFEKSHQLDSRRPWTPMAIAQMILRLELTDRYPEALSLTKTGLEYASNDQQLHERARSILTTLQGLFNAETQSELVSETQTALEGVTAKLDEIQKKREEFEAAQKRQMEELMQQAAPATQAETSTMDPGAGAEPPMPMEEPLELPTGDGADAPPPASE